MTNAQSCHAFKGFRRTPRLDSRAAAESSLYMVSESPEDSAASNAAPLRAVNPSHDCPYRSGTFAAGGKPQRPELTAREREVLTAWLRTDSKAIAARELFIASCTVSTHIERIRRKYIAVGRPAPTKSLLTIRAIQDEIICVCDLE